jgi:outer membrane protein assembly factor BamB
MKNIVLVLICLFLAVPSPAEIIIVDDDWPYDFDNIQAAIDDSNDGDIIVVFPGTYTGPGNYDIAIVGKSITVRSVAPQDPYIVDATVIDCNNLGSAFYFQGEIGTNTVIDGLTIINGNNYSGTIECQGPADQFSKYPLSTLTISNCNISNNTAFGGYGHGGGISAVGGLYIINNCTFSNNSALGTRSYGGAISSDGFPYFTDMRITNSIIFDNTTDNEGGAIYCRGGSLTVKNSLILRNRSAYNNGGAIYCYDGSRLTLINCTMTGNTADQDGGALYCGDTFAVVNNCTIASNTAGNNGGGIYGDATSFVKSINSILWANSDSNGVSETAQIYSLWPTSLPGLDIIYNCIQDDDPHDSNVPFGDPNYNIDDDPMFVRQPDDGGDGWADDPATPTVDEGANDDFGDLHLQTSSPCINTGFPGFLVVSNSADMDGQPRIIGERIDMGVDEFAPMLVVTEPLGDEVWIQNSTHQINWNSAGIAGTVDISYSDNDGADWTPVENNVSNTGSYIWQLPPAVDSDQCLVSIIPSTPDPCAVCVDSGLFTIKTDFIHPALTSTWKSLGGDFDRTGLSQNYGPELGCVKWQFETSARVSGSVTIGVDNRAHIACEDGKLYTLDSADGSLVWTYDANSPLLSSPTVGPNGSVYVGSRDGRLHVISIGGNIRWMHNTDGFIYSSPAVSDEGDIYVCSQDGALHALGNDGSELWIFDTNSFTASTGSVFASPSLGPDGTVYIAGLYDPNLYAIDPNDGSIKWTCTFDSNGWPFASPVISSDGAIYQTLLYDPNLYAIEPAAGAVIWSTNLADPCSGWFDSDYAQRYGTADGWSEPALGPDGTIYVALDDSHLRAVDPNGSINWVTRLGIKGGLTLTAGNDGLIYAAGDDGYLCVLDNTGAELAQFQRDGDWLNFPVIVADNTIIVTDSKDNTAMNDPPNNIVSAITGDDCQGQQSALHRPEDLSANRTIDLEDFALLAADWLNCTDENCNPVYDPLFTGYNYVDGRIYLTGDINRNLYLDYEDLEALANNWLSQE